jgi:hypothetical protein
VAFRQFVEFVEHRVFPSAVVFDFGSVAAHAGFGAGPRRPARGLVTVSR